MPISRRPNPKYRHYKPKNLAVVRLGGRDIYLGQYDTPESWERYHRAIAEWLTDPQPSSSKVGSGGESTSDGLTINDLMLAYMRFAVTYYVRDGAPSREMDGIRDSLRPLRQLYGHTLAEDFGPLRLKAVRQHLIDVQEICRSEINKRIGRIKRMFRWAVSEELLGPMAFHRLQAVTGLIRGRTTARESQPVLSVGDDRVDATLPFLTPQLAAMVQLQRLTGMRPGEVVIMRSCDMDRSGNVWIYRVNRHKNDWRGQERLVAIGPRGQKLLEPFLSRPATAYLFSPKEALNWRLEQHQVCCKPRRKTPIYPSELRRRAKVAAGRRRKRSGRVVGEHYTTRSYWRALQYAFRKAAASGQPIAQWFPNQLRHSRGTQLRRDYGIEGSRVSLGHASLQSTEIYAERDMAFAIRIAQEVG